MLVLASASPRRRDLLGLITPDFTVSAADVDESVFPGISPQRLVEVLSFQKAEAVFQTRGKDAVIGADTVVALDGEILGKPRGAQEAFRMLSALSGKTHTVFTGVSILAPGVSQTFSVAADVTFLPLSEREIRAYIATGEPLDKAGAYGIQGKGALLISGINGDFYTVMGLPVAALNRRLIDLGLI